MNHSRPPLHPDGIPPPSGSTTAMLGRSLIPGTHLRRPWAHSPPPAAGNLLFALFVAGVLAFTLLAATHSPEDPLLHPSSTPLTSFLTSSTSNNSLLPDPSLLRTGEDFPSSSSDSPNSSDAAAAAAEDAADPAPFISLDDIARNTDAGGAETADGATECEAAIAVDCAGDKQLFNLLMAAAIEGLPDLHFYRFGSPVPVPGDSTACDMAWRFRPKNDEAASARRRSTYYKDYRRFTLARDPATCELKVDKMGAYHSGVGAKKSRGRRGGRRGKKNKQPVADFVPPRTESAESHELATFVVVGEAVNDNLPVVASESEFGRGRYLIYMGGAKCQTMNYYLWGLLCALGEARYLNRTLVMDLKLCLSPEDGKSGKNREDVDFRFYFDFEHLKDSASVIDQSQFWTDWNKWHEKDGLKLYYVDDHQRVKPASLFDRKETLIMRQFGDAGASSSHWGSVCEGEDAVHRPWHMIWKSRRLTEIVSAIAARMNWDYDSIHIVRGEKALNTEKWPNLAKDTSPDSLIIALSEKMEAGRHLYIATDEADLSFFEPLKDAYNTHFLDEFKDLWGEGSEWDAETRELNNGVPVEFDGYMRVEVDTEVFLRGKKQLETFNDLTKDCKDGVGTCAAAADAGAVAS